MRYVALSLIYLIISLPLVLADEMNLIYDANGNLVTGDSYYREYNELNKLVRIRTGNLSSGAILEEFVWHPTEERILIKDVYYNGKKNYSIYYLSQDFIRIENSSGNYTEKYVYQDGSLVAQVDTDGNKQFLHNDHESTSSLVTDSSGNTIENNFFPPTGEIINGGKLTRFDYEAREFDLLTKLYDFRMYNPQRPPFEQPDTLKTNIFI